jgi:transketolase
MISAQQSLAREIRRTVLDRSRVANVGHIGSSLSIADILAALFSGAISLGERERERDRFILSKGHAALALYAVLAAKGVISAGELDTFCVDGSSLGAHPDHTVPGIDFSTGSLGHGLPIGVGAALAARLDGSERRVFVLLSDAECDAGSVWEAVLFAAHHGLGNLVAVVDVNGQQAFGYTRDVLNLEPLADKWQSFGWEVIEVDGHDVRALAEAFETTTPGEARPRVVLARTTFGKGVSFMESSIEWHYWPLSAAQYDRALKEVEA